MKKKIVEVCADSECANFEKEFGPNDSYCPVCLQHGKFVEVEDKQ